MRKKPNTCSSCFFSVLAETLHMESRDRIVQPGAHFTVPVWWKVGLAWDVCNALPLLLKTLLCLSGIEQDDVAKGIKHLGLIYDKWRGKHMPTEFSFVLMLSWYIETGPAIENWSSDMHTYSRDMVERVRERQRQTVICLME